MGKKSVILSTMKYIALARDNLLQREKNILQFKRGKDGEAQSGQVNFINADKTKQINFSNNAIPNSPKQN